jgi:hypothetical protein
MPRCSCRGNRTPQNKPNCGIPVGSFSKPSRTRRRDVVAAATEPLKTSPIVVSRWVRFPKRTHRKTSPSKVLNIWQGDGCAQNTPGKRWVRFAEWHVCCAPIFHKACRVVALAKTEGASGAHLTRAASSGTEASAKADSAFSKNCTDYTHLPTPCPAKKSYSDIFSVFRLPVVAALVKRGPRPILPRLL